MGNRTNSQAQTIQNQQSSQNLVQKENQKQKTAEEENQITKKKEENDLETEFFKLLAEGDRKNKWKTYFKINKIYCMGDLLSSYQMSATTKTGKRLNEAEKQILNNYLLRQSKEEIIEIKDKKIKDLIKLTHIEHFDIIEKIRNILIVGITGQGKSTFINSFVTAIEREFKPREKKKEISLDYFEIVKVKTDKAQSDTDVVSSYKFKIGDLVINLIDTPGLADTKGLEEDQKRITQISQFIEEHIHKKKQNLHAILFVSQSSTQYEVIDCNPSLLQLSMLSILKLFGTEMCAFTKHCLTFSDFTATSTQNFESQDSIFYSVREEQLMIKQRQINQKQNNLETHNLEQTNNINLSQNIREEEFYFQFQNSVFRAEKQGFIENIHFKKNLLNYEKLFKFISDNDNKGFGLENTVLVIKQREQIKIELGQLQQKLQQFIKVLKTLEENTRKLQIYKNKIEDSKEFQYKTHYTEWEKEEKEEKGQKIYSTNCSKCGKTCCQGCKSKTLNSCLQMIEDPDNGQINCQICNHSIKSHTQEDHFWQPVQKVLIKIDDILKKEYDNATAKLEEIKTELDKKEKEKIETKQKIIKTLIEMKRCIQDLLSSALYKLDILDVEAYDLVLKFYPDYQKDLEEFKIMEELKVNTEIKEKVKNNKLLVSKTLQSVETSQFEQKQFRRY